MPASLQVISDLHKKASYNKQDFYIDPDTGKIVMTAYYLRARGYCCKTGCRHCPWEK